MTFLKKFLAAALLAGAFCMSAAQAADAPQTGAERHVARGVACTSCHGKDMKSPEYPDESTCVQCHPRDKMIEKTKNVKPQNPHAAPHNGDCTLCHLQHEKPVDYCAQCHQFNFKVP